MFKLIIRRIAWGILTLFVISVLIFSAMELLPGDAANAALGQFATPEALEVYRVEHGLDRPAVVRYGLWLAAAVTGDFGVSLVSNQSIADQIGFRLANTLLLAAMVAGLAIPLAIFLGVFVAIKPSGLADRIINVSALAANSIPEFFIGYMLIWVFAVQNQFLPSLSFIAPGMSFSDHLRALVLPVATLYFVVFAHMMRTTRAAVLDVLQKPYIETATLKGLRARKIAFRHALPNALAPIFSAVGVNLSFLIVGVVVVEVVFVYPGMGQYMIESVSSRDIPVLLACSLIFSSIYIMSNLLVDISIILVNPRLRNPR